MKTSFFLTTFLAILLAPATNLWPKDTYTIAITQIVEHPALNSTRQGIIDHLRQSGYTEERLRIDYQCAQGSFITSTQIAQKFVSQKPDLIIAISTTSAQTVKKAAQNNSIPLLFTSVTDPYQAQLLELHPKVGSVANSLITGVSNYVPAKDQLTFFKQLLPNLQRIGMIYNPSEPNSDKMVKETTEAGKELGILVLSASVSKTTDLPMAAKSLANRVEALFVNNDNTALSGFESIAKVGIQQGLPIFSSDMDNISQQALAAFGPDQYLLGVQTAVLAIKILEGTSPGLLPLQYPEKVEGIINREVAKLLQITIPDQLAPTTSLYQEEGNLANAE